LSQLALPLQLHDYAVFDTFWREGNETALACIDDLVATRRGPGTWLWGGTATGKSHLLQAICARVGSVSAFLPLAELESAGPTILEGMADRSFVCIDDLQRIVGQEDWELALFRLFNDVRERHGVIVITASAAPRRVGLELADLASRFANLPIFKLNPLNDEQCAKALQLRAKNRGLSLPADAARYMLTRERRDMASLNRILERLDAEALAAQRRLTVPFVKAVLNDAD